MPNRAAPLDEMPEAGQAILTAARDIVEKNGPNSLRVSDVAERAGVAVGLLQINGEWEDHMQFAVVAEDWAVRGPELLRTWVL